MTNLNTKDFRLQWCKPISNLEAKQKIAETVASKASNGDTIGAGSGSTSFLTVLALSEKQKKENLFFNIVPTSIEIELACAALGLNIIHSIPESIDWCFDGADEVSKDKRILKGRGGALYREKLVFNAAKKRFIIADKSKTTENLGEKFLVPVEVDKTCIAKIFNTIESMKNVENLKLRMACSKDGPVITEMGNVILDVKMSFISTEDEQEILSIPGVLATGIFSNYIYERIT